MQSTPYFRWSKLQFSFVRTTKFESPSPLRIVDLYSSTLAQINKFVRGGIKQQMWVLPEDENKGESLNITEYVYKLVWGSQWNTIKDIVHSLLSMFWFKLFFFWYFFDLPSLLTQFFFVIFVPLNIWR